MTDDPTPPPLGWTAGDTVMAELRAWLVERGFIVLRDHYDSASFGNQEVMLTRPIAVRLVRDRGEWRVEVLGADGQWSGIDRWRQASHGTGSQLLSAAEQADILRATLDAIEHGSSS